MSKINARWVCLAMLSASLLYSCEKDTPDAGTSGDDRDKFLGTWHVTSQHSQFGTQFWDLTITASNSSPSEILLANFNLQSGVTRRASVSGNQFSLVTENASGETISGGGSYSNGNLAFSYTSNDGQAIDSVTATAHK